MSVQGLERFRTLFAEEAAVRLAHLGQLLLTLEAGGGRRETVDEVFREVHTLKGAAAVVEFGVLSGFAHDLEERLAALRAGPTLTPAVVDDLLGAVDRLGRLVTASLEGRPDSELRAIAAERASDAPRDVPPDVPTDATATAAVPTPPPQPELVPARPASQSRGSILVPVERLEDLVRLVGEAASAELRVERLVRERLGVTAGRITELAELSRLLNDVQDRAMRTQMVPIATITDQLWRAVRDLSRTLGKDVRWEVEGDQTELERNMLQQLADSLLHVVRNAVDHGIEGPEERRRAGKPEQGTVHLHAAQLGSEVIISVTDDGRGVDVAAVREAAVAHGIDTDVLSDAEMLQLVFRSGFSTARLLTAISGRGVGLDVVHATVDAVRGRAEIQSELGVGTTIRLVVPITLAVLPCLLVEAGGQRFAIPLHRVVVARADEAVTAHGEGHPFLWLDDEPVQISHLSTVLGQSGDVPASGPTIVVNGTLHRHAFQVDALVDHRDVVVKGLSGVLPLIGVVAGTSIEPDGSVLVVLDPPGLVERTRHVVAATSIGGPVRGSAPQRLRILVVDDALTVRELQRSILGRAGFDVSVAVDGVDALAQLAAGGVDLVLTDVQMPRMDGFTLTRAIRADATMSSVPILIVTTLDSVEDRREGMEAGADGYIVKAGFDERTLLEAVRGALGEGS
ncbi:MAG: response regulator [Ilumatobacteraceae bacterium]